MKQNKTKIYIDPYNLSVYAFNDSKKYDYIDDKSLCPVIKLQIIDNLERNNKMPNNFLNFVYVTYIDYLKGIYNSQINGISEADYSPNSKVMNAYGENQFGFIIKVDEKYKKNQQLMLYCLKEPSLYHQFFLRKALIEEKFNRKNLILSLPRTKNPNKSVDNNNINANEIINIGEVELNDLNINKSVKSNLNNKIDISDNTSSKTTSKKDNDKVDPDLSVNFFEKEISIDRFINGNIFEYEVCDYLRDKILSNKDNIELPNVFYALKSINNAQDQTYFYNEFS